MNTWNSNTNKIIIIITCVLEVLIPNTCAVLLLNKLFKGFLIEKIMTIYFISAGFVEIIFFIWSGMGYLFYAIKTYYFLSKVKKANVMTNHSFDLLQTIMFRALNINKRFFQGFEIVLDKDIYIAYQDIKQKITSELLETIYDKSIRGF